MITAVFTSCGRFDLLQRTLGSFLKHADLPLEFFGSLERKYECYIK